MTSAPLAKTECAGTGVLLIACVGDHGSAAHPYFSSPELLSDSASRRNLADAVHFLACLHARFPGLVDHAAARAVDPESRRWFAAAEQAVAVERQYLAQLCVAAGPVPSTPGGGTSEAAIVAQRNTMATLGQSDRRGCALGAALAFCLDWLSVRARLDDAATRFGLTPPSVRLGDEHDIRQLADMAGQTPAVERALLFGAQQLALQHRGLWDLLEARQQARAGN